ncbi:TetR/AcrR family transcriptional regulator [Pendulispora albinea]|uniref:TetR/AcrR family transcriptional regulator n=1 Tax=Pendulispora albinea TaxID=2741071 RepID=A0ABZ2LT75_9BACT
MTRDPKDAAPHKPPERRTQPTDPNVIRWVNIPLQERSRLKLDRMVSAFEKLVAVRGLDGATVADIAREAGCSVGAFYTRFKDKGDLFRYVVLHHLEEGLQTLRTTLQAENWRDVPAHTVVRSIVTFIVDLHRQHEGFLRAFYEEAHKDPIIMSRVSDAGVEVEGVLLTLLLERHDEITHPDPRTAVGFAVRLVMGTMQLRSLLSPHTPKETHFAWRTWSEELTTNLIAYLGIAPPKRDASDI